MEPPSKTQDLEKLLIFQHPRIGQRTYTAFGSQALMQFRNMLEMSSELHLFTNYYFESKGVRLVEHQCIANLSSDKQIKIDIIFGAFDYKNAQHHIIKTMECIFDPEYYLFLCKNQSSSQNGQKQSERSIKNLNISDIQNICPDLTNPLLLSSSQVQRKVNLLLSFSLSGFNPVPTSEKLNGDILYLHARTLENQDIHITCCPLGFYVNQSKISHFNPAKSPIYKGVYGSLIDLLKSVSDKFRQNLQIFLSEVSVTDAMKYKFLSMDRVRKKKWLDFMEQEHGWNQRKNIIDEQFKAQLINLKDWNQIFQYQFSNAAQQQLSKDEKLQKLGQLSRVYAQFELAAYQGATLIIDGKLAPLNPTDDKKKHIYIYNKIFFSLANETVYDHSLEKGEDATPSSSSINTDLMNIQILYNLGIPDVHVLHMAIINYRGYKVIAQCIIPGILSIDQMSCSQYGSIDDGKTVENNPQFEKIMIQVCEKLGIEENIEVVDANGIKKRIAGSPDIKGILGSDKRKYILDLLRLSPRDLNYEGTENETCMLRPQLIRNYKKSKGKQKLKFNVNIGTDIQFQKSQHYEQQLNLLKDAANYLKKTAIKNLIQTLKNFPSHYLTNNQGITKAFHFWGVNMRYLGEVCNHEDVKNQVQIRLVLERIILVRSLKHLIRMAMRQSNIMHLGATIINMLNCVFGRKPHILYMQEGIIQNQDNGDKNVDKETKKKKKKKNKEANQPTIQVELTQVINIIKIQPNRFVSMKPEQVWDEVCKIAKARFKYDLPKSQLAFEPFKLPFQKLATLRDACLSVGLVLERKNYDIFQTNSAVNASNDKILPFTCKNIISLEPRLKRMNIQPLNLNERQKLSEQLISTYQVKQALGIDSVLEKQNLVISGGLNESAVKLFSRMSRVLYMLGQNQSAISQEEKNLSMLESLHSQDYSLNIQSHINLGLYYIANNDKNKVIYYMVKGIYLMLITFGETSPDLLVSFANLARIYQMNKQYKEAIRCYKVAMKFIEQIHGKFHVKISFCYTSLATICYQMADIKSAIEYQAQNVSILTKILSQTDSKLTDAQKILKMYKQMQYKSQQQSNMVNFARASEVLRKNEEQKQKQYNKKKNKKN